MTRAEEIKTELRILRNIKDTFGDDCECRTCSSASLRIGDTIRTLEIEADKIRRSVVRSKSENGPT